MQIIIYPIDPKKLPGFFTIEQQKIFETQHKVLYWIYKLDKYYTAPFNGEDATEPVIKGYINSLFKIINWLRWINDSNPEKCELGQRYFELLSTAADKLENLYNAKIDDLDDLKDKTQKTDLILELCEFKYKVAEIFSIGKVMTTDVALQESYQINETDYRNKADKNMEKIGKPPKTESIFLASHSKLFETPKAVEKDSPDTAPLLQSELKHR